MQQAGGLEDLPGFRSCEPMLVQAFTVSLLRLDKIIYVTDVSLQATLQLGYETSFLLPSFQQYRSQIDPVI